MTENFDQDPSPHQPEMLLAEARRLDWAKGLSEEVLEEIAESGEFVTMQAGDTVQTVEDGVASVYLIITGRVRVDLRDAIGELAAQDWMTRGRALGLFSIGLTDHSKLHAEVTEPTTAIRITLPLLLKLSRNSDFQLALMGLATDVVKRLYMVDRSLPRPKVVGIVHHADDTHELTVRLSRRLSDLGESVAIVGDQERFPFDSDLPYRSIYRDGSIVGLDERKGILNEWADKDRLLVDLGIGRGAEILKRLFSYTDTLLWCLRPSDLSDGLRLIRSMVDQVPDWASQIQVVWLMDEPDSLPPHSPELKKITSGNIKLCFKPSRETQGSLPTAGLERIVHSLRGIKIGLALGGGAARGMAHLGVLKALEQHGIHVDMIAGTSAGAMTGTIYAAGLDPEYTIQCFKSDLKPNRLFRHLPAGGYWYLTWKYRTNRFDPMLRKYLFDYHMDQLFLPTFTVAVDLVEGVPLIRDSGDATNNILESINLPPLALPIVRNQQAVVDGGLLNNVPADVLVQKGCNFVIASTVTAKLEKDFMGIRSQNGRQKPRLFTSAKVAMRQTSIQHRNMNAVGVEPADFVIAPDVSSFDLSEFTRADEMASIGEAETIQEMGKLRKLLSSIDPQLFR